MVTENYTKIILKYVKKLVPNVRKPKYSSEYYLTNILNILTDFVSWKSLIKSDSVDRKITSTITKQLRMYIDYGVKRAFIKVHSTKLYQKKLRICQKIFLKHYKLLMMQQLIIFNIFCNCGILIIVRTWLLSSRTS